jgi:hypothetical protein
MLRETDLAFQFQHSVFKNADAGDQRTLVAFELGHPLPVRFRETIERLQDFSLRVADGFR